MEEKTENKNYEMVLYNQCFSGKIQTVSEIRRVPNEFGQSVVIDRSGRPPLEICN